MTRPGSESEVVENYLKAIRALSQRSGADAGAETDAARREPRRVRAGDRAAGGLVSLGDLADALSITPGTVTSMVKRLAQRGLLRYERYGGVALTPRGERLAESVQRRHRIVETFLVRTLGLDWSEVHDEAERLEHSLSDRVLEALDRLLGHPTVDPHGDPIPRAGAVRRSTGSAPPPASRRHGEILLSQLAPGASARVARLLRQSASFLRLASARGLTPGAELTVLGTGRRGAVIFRVRGRRRAEVTRSVADGVLLRSGAVATGR